MLFLEFIPVEVLIFSEYLLIVADNFDEIFKA